MLQSRGGDDRVDDRRKCDSTKRGDYRQRPRAKAGEVADRELTFDFQSDDKEEYGQ